MILAKVKTTSVMLAIHRSFGQPASRALLTVGAMVVVVKKERPPVSVVRVTVGAGRVASCGFCPGGRCSPGHGVDAVKCHQTLSSEISRAPGPEPAHLCPDCERQAVVGEGRAALQGDGREGRRSRQAGDDQHGRDSHSYPWHVVAPFSSPSDVGPASYDSAPVSPG